MSDPTSGVLEDFRSVISNAIYDTVDLSTKVSHKLRSELDKVNAELESARAEIASLKAQLLSSCGPSLEDFPAPELSLEQKNKADVLSRCVNMTARMTACQCVNQTDGSIRLMCGGMMLKPGDTFDGLQANWDLIDTAVGADS